MNNLPVFDGYHNFPWLQALEFVKQLEFKSITILLFDFEPLEDFIIGEFVR